MILFCHRVGKLSVRISIVRSEKIGIAGAFFVGEFFPDGENKKEDKDQNE